MRIEPEIGGVSIVLRGDFNPAIFTPAWFVLHALLPRGAADAAEVQIVHPRVTAFTFDWLHLEVRDDHFSAETLQAPDIRLRDLVLCVFKEHLPHTPLKVLGINRQVHFRVRSSAERDRIGRMLAPVEPWGAWGQSLALDGEKGGMMSLTMTGQAKCGGRPTDDRINVKVEPSAKIGDGRLGVYVRVNDHYVIDDAGPGDGMRVMRILEENFETSVKRSDCIVDHVMSLAGGKGD